MEIGLCNKIEIGEVKPITPNQLKRGHLYYFTDYTGKDGIFWREIIGLFVSFKQDKRTNKYWDYNTYNFKVLYCSNFGGEGYKQLKVGSITRQSPKDCRLKNLCEILELNNSFIKTILLNNKKDGINSKYLVIDDLGG